MKKKNFISVLMVLATIFFGCHGGKLRSVPDELQGVWKLSLALERENLTVIVFTTYE